MRPMGYLLMLNRLRALEQFDLELTPQQAFQLLTDSEKKLMERLQKIFDKGEKLFYGIMFSEPPSYSAILTFICGRFEELFC
jgi:hypothetical protein